MSYRGEPFDTTYFVGDREEGFQDYTLTQEFFGNRADDLESILGLVSGKNVLVVGCAFGYFCNELYNRGADVVGVDISTYAISQAEALFPHLTFENRDFLIPFGNPRQYDIIVACEILSIMPTMIQIGTFLQEAKRVVKNNGTYYFLIWNKQDDAYLVINQSDATTLSSTAFPEKTIEINEVGHLPIMADLRVVIY